MTQYVEPSVQREQSQPALAPGTLWEGAACASIGFPECWLLPCSAMAAPQKKTAA